MSTDLSRRAIVAGAASVPALAVPAIALASTEPDPIFAAIERHRAAATAWLMAVHIEFSTEAELPRDKCKSRITEWDSNIVETDDPRWPAAIKKNCETRHQMSDAAIRLTEIEPTTIAGAMALLRYYMEVVAGKDSCIFPESVCEVSDDEEVDLEEPRNHYSYFLVGNVVDALEQITADGGVRS